jgi:cellulose synthase/poly-beta-1,6-N-acetylglucosamine synthase-like glycosyltransferase
MAEILVVWTVLFCLLCVHPFVIYPWTLELARRWNASPLRASYADRPDRLAAREEELTFAICLCAYNEAAIIEQTIESLLKLRRRTGRLQILLYVDGATDGTAEIAGRYAGEIELLVSPERHGKSHGLNRLSQRVRAPIMVLADANVRIAEDALVNMEKYFRDEDVGCVCGHLVYSNGDDSVTAQTGSLYWRLEEKIKRLESETGSVMGADGSLYAMRSELFHPIPEGVADDMYLSLAVLCDGYRVIRAEDVRVFEAAGVNPKDEFRRKIRIACQAFSTHRALWSQLRQLDGFSIYKYVSHKLLRWFTVFTLAGTALTAFAALAVLIGLGWAAALSALGIGALALALRLHVRPLPMVLDMLRSFAATGIGVVHSLRGANVRTWEPARAPAGQGR